MRTRFQLLGVLSFVLLAACTSAAAGTASATSSPAPVASPTPSPVAQPSPTPKPTAGKPAPPANRQVLFARLRPGVYPVHLHSRCDGSQQFHITVLQSLEVGTAGSGAIAVPRGYFGRGLCVIVYGSNMLATVIATRSI